MRSTPYTVLVAETRVAVWDVGNDVVDSEGLGYFQNYRTVIAASGHAPSRGSIVACGDFQSAPTGVLTALGKVQRVQSVATARVRVRVEPFFVLDTPIELDLLLPRLDAGTEEQLEDAVWRRSIYPRRLTPRASLIFLDAMRSVSREASEYIDNLLAQPALLAESELLRLREERDAVHTALGLAGMMRSAPRGPHIERVLRAGVPFGLTVHRHHVVDNEDDLISSDLRRFDDQARLREVTGSIFRITDRKLHLTVMNVNRKELERVYGVDLIYYDHVEDTAVAVQYKRMVMGTGASGEDWAYKNREDLEKQLKLMKLHTTAEATTARDWRLSSSPNFFKFVWQQQFDSDSRRLLPGMYVPAEYLRLGISEGIFRSGPQGGFQITKRNTKYFTSEVFVQLVRRCWIGTRQTDRTGLVEHAAYRAQNHEVVLALRTARNH